MKKGKYPLLLLLGIGISNVGAWIYLIALNLIVLDESGSALAVGILYVLKPLAALFTNSWAGSVIDRMNKRNAMVALDLFRGALIGTLPFISSMELMYAVVFIINMASAMFYPTSITYMTKLIPAESRQRFNALKTLIGSGAFLIGPAIAGVLFIIGTPVFALYMNALALILSGMITLLLPNLDTEHTAGNTVSIELLKKDWQVVWSFSLRHTYVMLICFLFSLMLVMTAAVDSLEAAFSKEVLSLSNSTYGYLVSIAGGGFVVGSIVNTVFVKRLQPSLLIGIGSVMVSAGYVVYSISNGFTLAAIGVFVLSFALAFANTGFQTFYQNNIPVEIMGRVGSIYGLIEGVLVIITTILIGVLAHLISLETMVITGCLTMLIVTIILCFYSLYPKKLNNGILWKINV
ncbi:MFS transporter [Rossellomorea aquimaris]|uniref:MFS transporter n=1 Tax=Rossellomorea aquimaris TaxID=189382 RepID=UPI0007D09A83|nr:MFS transporter [Rossellomorea aquimaris]